MAEEERKRSFMAKAQQQRQKIYTMKANQDEMFHDDEQNEREVEAMLETGYTQPKKLTSDNLSKIMPSPRRASRFLKKVRLQRRASLLGR